MSYENLFIGDFSDEDKNKMFLKEPLEPNSVKFEKDGFAIKLENGVELIHVENGIVIRVAQGKETPMKADHEKGNLYTCHECGQKLDWED